MFFVVWQNKLVMGVKKQRTGTKKSSGKKIVENFSSLSFSEFEQKYLEF